MTSARISMHRLILTSTKFAGQSCELPDGTFTLGRSHENKIVIQHDSVSARHCEFLVHGAEVIVRERGSRNGTFINGTRVRAQGGVSHGQTLRFGAVEALMQIEMEPWEDDISETAYHAHCKFMKISAAGLPDLPRFPVIFTAREERPGNTTVGVAWVLRGSICPAPERLVESPSGRLPVACWIALAGLSLLVLLWFT
jgi:hypothetical protein